MTQDVKDILQHLKLIVQRNVMSGAEAQQANDGNRIN